MAIHVLNLYSGLGGNRKNWSDCWVTAVENYPKIAAIYERLHPKDEIIIGDAHEYLIEHFEEFNFIWTSPPCQTHSKMNRATRHKSTRRYIDGSLWQEIVFLKTYFKGLWVVENVSPYYEPLIAPTVKMGRHCFWSNFPIAAIEVAQPKGFIERCDLAGKKALQEWLGIYYEENVYYKGNHCPAQILRNCVHPIIGEHIFKTAREVMGK